MKRVTPVTPVDPSWTAADLLERARRLAALALHPLDDDEHRAAITEHAQELQLTCERAACAALPPLRRHRRVRVEASLERLVLAADDLAAVVLLRCAGRGPVREQVLPDLVGLLRRVGERHDQVVGQLRRSGVRRTSPAA